MDSFAPGQLALLDVFATICSTFDGVRADELVQVLRNGQVVPFSNAIDDLKKKTRMVDQLSAIVDDLKPKAQQVDELTGTIKDLEIKVQEVSRLHEENERLQACLNDALNRLQTKRQEERLSTKKRDSFAGSSSGISSRTEKLGEDAEYGSSPALDRLDDLDLTMPKNVAMLKEKYRRLSYKCIELEGAKDIAIKQWKKKQEQFKQWVAYSDGLMKRIEKLEGEKEDPNVLPNFIDRNAYDEPVSIPQHFYSGTTEDDTEAIDREALEDRVDQVDHPDNPDPYIKKEEDDTPVVVSERVLKKRKAPEEPEADALSMVKEEQVLSSSPIGLARLARIDAHESMDLDEDHRQGITPRKKKRFVDFNEPAKARLQRSGRLNLTDREGDRRSDDQYREVVSALAGEQDELSLETPAARRSLQQPLHKSVLQPRSPNKILPRTSIRPTKKRLRIEDRMHGAVAFGGDGEDSSTLQQSETTKTKCIAAEEKRRLSSLLEVPSPRKSVLTPAQNAKSRPSLQHQEYTGLDRVRQAGDTSKSKEYLRLSKNATVCTPATESARGQASNSIIRRRGLKTKDEAVGLEAIDPSHEPFRARPLHKLSLEHFKINSAYNQGYEFAFSDVVRGKENRKCMAGCSKPECCGDKFRLMAEAISDNHGVQTLSQEDADRRLLEDFMGHKKARLTAMTAEERYEVLLQAKANELSKNHGKHRSVYERRKSPPGFWRTDFPSTQEAEEDRVEAGKAERLLVEQRWNEAMREGGKWVFRDEYPRFVDGLKVL